MHRDPQTSITLLFLGIFEQDLAHFFTVQGNYSTTQSSDKTQQLSLKTSVSENLLQPSVEREDLIKVKHCASETSITRLVTEPKWLWQEVHQRKDLCEIFLNDRVNVCFCF